MCLACLHFLCLRCNGVCICGLARRYATPSRTVVYDGGRLAFEVPQLRSCLRPIWWCPASFLPRCFLTLGHSNCRRRLNCHFARALLCGLLVELWVRAPLGVDVQPPGSPSHWHLCFFEDTLRHYCHDVCLLHVQPRPNIASVGPMSNGLAFFPLAHLRSGPALLLCHGATRHPVACRGRYIGVMPQEPPKPWLRLWLSFSL